MQGELLGCLIADPNVAQLPFHVFAVEHVSEKHLVPCQCFPGKKGEAHPDEGLL